MSLPRASWRQRRQLAMKLKSSLLGSRLHPFCNPTGWLGEEAEPRCLATMLLKCMYRHVGVIVTKKGDIVLVKEDKKETRGMPIGTMSGTTHEVLGLIPSTT